MSVQSDPRIGSVLAGYRIERLLGRGGMGVVYLAHDPRLKRNVALKLLAPELANDDGFRERFLHESELAASLDHQNVIPIYEAGEADGVLFIAMRYVEGTDLARLLADEGPLEPARTVGILAQVASALDTAHQLGLVHRDVKPSNILLAADEHVYLADFGLTRTGGAAGPTAEYATSLGTVDYVAPEQIDGDPLDAQADLYSLGCVLYECLTGQPPYRADTSMGVLWSHLQADPPSAHEIRPELPDQIDTVIAHALAKQPNDRHHTCTELIDDARNALGLAGRPRRLVVLGLAAIAVLAAAAVTVAVVVSGGQGAVPPPSKPVLGAAVARVDAQGSALDPVFDTGVIFTYGRLAAGENAVWLTNPGRRTVTRIAKTTGAAVTTAVAGSPTDVAVGAGSVWVAGFDEGQGTLTDVDPASGNAQRTVGLPYARLVAVAAGAEQLWVAANDPGRGNAVLRIDPVTLEVVASVPFEQVLRDLAVGEGAVWATTHTGGQAGAIGAKGVLTRIDPQTAGRTGEVLYPESGTAVTGGSRLVAAYGAVWAIGGFELLRIDAATLDLTAQVPVTSTDVYDIAAGAGAIWLGVGDVPGEVLRIDPDTLEVSTIVSDNRNPVTAVGADVDSAWAYCDCFRELTP